jgi:exopolyphosphatase/guanosine-5'-triphosphate,3'-diphosphate pyrophosphatase
MKSADQREEFLAFLRELEPEPAHVLHVARLAMQLFDGLAALHELGEPGRILLEGAACLHDIGWSTGERGKDHHKESARLIRKRKWQHFDVSEVNLIAIVARYHRKSVPKLEHEDFAALPAPDQLRVQKLAALLRLADAFDRSHQQFVSSLSCRVLVDRVLIELTATTPLLRELAAAHRKADLARTVFAREFLFHLRVDSGGVMPFAKS